MDTVKPGNSRMDVSPICRGANSGKEIAAMRWIVYR